MLRIADSFPRGDATALHTSIRVQRYDVLLAVPDGALARAAHKIPIGYVLMDPENSWNRWVHEYGLREWLDDFRLDGLELDCIFDFPDPVAQAERIAAAIHPLPIVPNFGDFYTWAGYNPLLRAAAADLGVLAPWHFVQVAYDMRAHSAQKWRTLRHHANFRLAAGKKLVLGIYDPGREHEQLAALLTQSFEHPNLYWHYNTSAQHPMELEHQWNEYWELAR